MLKIQPKTIVLNLVLPDSLRTWPDTLPIDVKASSYKGQVQFVVQSAGMIVPEGPEVDAICAELSKKQGMVPVTVMGLETEEDVLVYNCYNHPQGKLLICLAAKPEKGIDITGFTQQIWPTEN